MWGGFPILKRWVSGAKISYGTLCTFVLYTLRFDLNQETNKKISSSCSVIVRVSVVLKRTVADSD